MTGSGKTTFVNRYLLNEVCACRFIFDDLNRMWPRLNVRPCFTVPELEASLETRWSVFQPLRLFHGDTKAAFKWWAAWVYQVANRGRGKKMVCIPELWRHCTEDSIPQELALLSQAGRELHVELIVDTQRPELVNESITGAATEIVVFKLVALDALRVAEKLCQGSGGMIAREQIGALPLGQFVAFNRLTGGRIDGRVF
jgi:hypothetical protein